MPKSWRPVASLESIRQRAEFLQTVRTFMAERDILEVDTPVMAEFTVTDPNIESFPCTYHPADTLSEYKLYLQTSPEYAMKRLLASGSGPIYQICKAFRDQETGRLHTPEFTLLEWYRPGFDMHEMMDEIEALLTRLGLPPCDRYSYREVFTEYCDLDPHRADENDLLRKAREQGLAAGNISTSNHLEFLFEIQVVPHFEKSRPVFIYDYPVCQAALARIRDETPPVAERFELYIKGVEVANGFNELCDANEQRNRFLQDISYRKLENRKVYDMDEKLLGALSSGLPDCTGVAIGVERLLMLLDSHESIHDVMTFPLQFKA